MGKVRATRHQKFVKSEKAKVKLKQKKELPKGTNVTNTTFKIKKIVVAEQLKTSTDGPLSKYKLSLKELLSRLQHFNTSSRKDALEGIKQLVGTNPEEILGVHVGQLISGVTPLVLDKERIVRREAFQTLHYILLPLETEKISPFFDVLCSYLRCAMTHIDTNIHEDSVFYFDILIDNAPDLVAVNAHKIFPSFLDMISKLRIDSKPGRTLLVNLGSKMTSVKWRSKVLSRLLQFLKILNNLHLKSKGIVLAETDTLTSYYFEDKENVKHNINTKTVFYNKDQLNYFPLYKGIGSQLCFTKEKNIMNKESENENQKLRAYTEVLLPLLFDTWLEVRPVNLGNAKSVESVISEEAVTILKEILEIFLLTWNLLKLTDEHLQMTELTEWFVEKYQRSFSQLLSNAFPYTQSMAKTKKKNQPTENTSGEKCLEENLMICHVYTILNYKIVHNYQKLEADRILSYIRWSLDNISDKNIVCQSQVIAILTCILKSEDWITSKGMIPLLDTIIDVYTAGSGVFKEHIFTLLCNILLSDHLKVLQCTPSFQTWLGNLPDAISNEETISEKSFDVIMRFAVQNNKLFNESIKSKLIAIVENLPKIRMADVQNEAEAKKKIINLFYWISGWDVNSLNMLQCQLESKNLDFDTKEYLIDILKLKTEGLFAV